MYAIRSYYVIREFMQRLGPLPDALLENVVGTAQCEVRMPLATQRCGELPALDRVKRLLEKENAVRRRDFRAEVLRRRAERTGHDHDVYVGIEIADASRSLDAISYNFV